MGLERSSNAAMLSLRRFQDHDQVVQSAATIQRVLQHRAPRFKYMHSAEIWLAGLQIHSQPIDERKYTFHRTPYLHPLCLLASPVAAAAYPTMRSSRQTCRTNEAHEIPHIGPELNIPTTLLLCVPHERHADIVCTNVRSYVA